VSELRLKTRVKVPHSYTLSVAGIDSRAMVGIMSLLKRNRLTLVLLVILSLACVLSAGVTVARAETAQSLLPPPTGHVNDYANVIDAATKQRLENILENLKQRANTEFAVVTVKTTGDTDIYSYSLAVARGWGIGATDDEKNGLLFLVAIDDRKYFTQVSRHLEGDLPDGLVGQIQRERLVPQFKQQRYSQGIYDTVEAYVATLAEKRGFSIEGIDQKQAYRDTEPSNDGSGRMTARGISPFAIIVIVVILLLVFSGRGRGGGGGGCLNMFLLGSLLNSGSRGGSGWGGGGFGGSGGGGGFGGFGGGGDFGGGGAGGSW
jgi:uncharacterized protein